MVRRRMGEAARWSETQIESHRFQTTDLSPSLADLVQMPILVHPDFLGSPLLDN